MMPEASLLVKKHRNYCLVEAMEIAPVIAIDLAEWSVMMLKQALGIPTSPAETRRRIDERWRDLSDDVNS